MATQERLKSTSKITVTTDSSSNSTWIVGGAFVLALIPLLGFWAYGLFDMDEGFYASVTSAMLQRKDWLIPYYNGQPWFEKPILLYWFTAPSLAMFGGEFGLRLPSILTTLTLSGVLYAWGKKYLSPASGLMAMLVYATSLLVVLIGRMMLTDAIFVLFLSLSFLSFYSSLIGEKKQRFWSGFCLGLAVLAKGPIALIFFILLGGLTYWREPKLRDAFRGYWVLSIFIFLSTVSLWYLPALLTQPKIFIQQFLIEQNIQRFLGGDTVHRLPLFWLNLIFFPTILFIGMLPWSIWIFKAWPKQKLIQNAENEDQKKGFFLRFLTRWFLLVLFLFSLSGSKLPHYILPAAPALALFLGDWLGRRRPQTFPGKIYGKRLLVPGVCSLFMFLLTYGGMAWYYGLGNSLNQEGQLRLISMRLKNQSLPVSTYQIGKRPGEETKGKFSLLATSQPSLLFYLGKNILEFEEFQSLLHAPKPLWVITRPGRFTSDDFKEVKRFNQQLVEYPLSFWLGHSVDSPKFEVFLMSKKKNSISAR